LYIITIIIIITVIPLTSMSSSSSLSSSSSFYGKGMFAIKRQINSLLPLIVICYIVLFIILEQAGRGESCFSGILIRCVGSINQYNQSINQSVNQSINQSI